ncbi:hypothetical protein DFH28DRAFT_629711 [Melampsora americana]|nr:hypothetical protein DFH28DRAFT_629711 [Melampsora americana]
MTMSKNTLLQQQQQQQLSASPSSGDLSASIDTLPPRRGQDLFGVGGIPIGRSGPTGHQHSRTKSKTDFLDLADSSTRLSNSPEVNARLEQKRAEHERQKAEQKRVFAAQMRALEAQHESEERELMGVPASAPTTPPRSDDDSERVGIRDVDDHRSSNHRQLNQYGNIGVAKTSAFREFANNSKSVPASRRHSGQEDDLLGLDKLNLGGLGNSLAAPFSKNANRHPHKLPNANHETPSVTSFLFDDELESDLQHSTFGGKYLQMNTDDDKFPILVRRDSFPGMLSASSAALDLAPLAQTPPRHSNLMRPTPTSRGGEWSPFDSPNAYRPLPHSQLIEGDRSRHGTQTQVPTPVSFHADTRASPVSDRGASPRLTRVVHMNGSTTARTPSTLSGP